MDGRVILLVVLLGGAFIAYATRWRRVDAPVNPPGRAIVRKNYQYWWQSFKGLAGPALWFGIGLVLGLHWPH